MSSQPPNEKSEEEPVPHESHGSHTGSHGSHDGVHGSHGGLKKMFCPIAADVPHSRMASPVKRRMVFNVVPFVVAISDLWL